MGSVQAAMQMDRQTMSAHQAEKQGQQEKIFRHEQLVLTNWYLHELHFRELQITSGLAPCTELIASEA